MANVAASFAPVAEAEEVGREVRLAADLPRIQADGLRLAIVRALVEAHGGTIAASDSRHGTAFTITLPLT